VQNSKNDRNFVAASLAENSKKNPTTGLRDVTCYDVTAWSAESHRSDVGREPKDYVRVIGYPAAKAFTRKNGAHAASIAITIVSVEVLQETRPAAAAQLRLRRRSTKKSSFNRRHRRSFTYSSGRRQT
jgi:hypothetical protein